MRLRAERRGNSTRKPLTRACAVGAWSALLLSTLLAATLPGCSGCQRDPAAQKKKEGADKKKKEKRKPDYEGGRWMTQPNEITRPEGNFKPGHWTSAAIDFKANNFHFNGELRTEPLDLPGMPFRMSTSRPAVLPKGQRRFLEQTLYVPAGRFGQQSRQIRTLLTARGSRRGVVTLSPPALTPLREHQFYFVVLARSPERYGHLRSLPAVTGEVRHKTGSREYSGMSDPDNRYYHVRLPPVDNRVPLPTNALTWTSIAYLLWDDFEPNQLSEPQQQALVDWLHWGGQLIVSGPNSLDLLGDSFLAPYLPPAAVKTVELSDVAINQLNEWNTRGESLPVDHWRGIHFELAAESPFSYVPDTGELLVERKVGRGRVVVSGFSLGERRLGHWLGFDSLLSSCLMRRKPRRFDVVEDALDVRWKKKSFHPYDATLVSSLRYFTRDTGADQTTGSSSYDLMETDVIGAGVAGWSDTNSVASTVRESLGRAAGIEVPDANLVLGVMGVYLLVMVPLNWGFFRLLSRVELAWVAVPVVSIVFAVGVVRVSQLDIGFVRARTEIAVIEAHTGYDRAHVTRYTAVYNSLGTNYELRFEDASALVQPFPTEANPRLLEGQSRRTVDYRRAREEGDDGQVTHVSLSDYVVPSNTTRMLHSEHLTELGGALSLQHTSGGRVRLVNTTDVALRGAGVVRPGAEKDTFEAAWVGELAPGSSTELEFEGPLERKSLAGLWRTRREASPVTSRAVRLGEVNIRALVDLAQKSIEDGETRLVAWSSDEMPGMFVEPLTRQTRQANLIVAHLGFSLPEHPTFDEVSHRFRTWTAPRTIQETQP